MSFKIENGVLEEYLQKNGETEVIIPDGVTEIGWNAFEYCRSIKSVTIPDSVTEIGERAFEYCTSLE